MKKFFAGVIFGAIVVGGTAIEYTQHGWGGVGGLFLGMLFIPPFVILLTWLME